MSCWYREVKVDSKKLKGWGLVVVGFLGLGFTMFSTDSPLDLLVFGQLWWWFLMLLFSTVCLCGLLGISYSSWNQQRLRKIDLIWVIGSAVAFLIGAVEASQRIADIQRKNAEEIIILEIRAAATDMREAHRTLCELQSVLSELECAQLKTFQISLEGGNLPDEHNLTSFCHFPIQLDKPPARFNFFLIQGCLSANYAIRKNQEPILRDQENVETWRTFSFIWPILFVFLIALRIAKSVAEVCWKVV